MDNNTFGFDALFDCDDFVRYESRETKMFFDALSEFVGNNTNESMLEDEFYDHISDYRNSLFNDGFKQGFCFAIKAIKFLIRI